MVNFFLIFGVAISGIYLFPSGMPQITDFVLATFAGLLLFNGFWKRKPFYGIELLRPFLFFVAWAFAVQIAWLWFVPTLSLLPPVYFLFNFIIICALTQYLCSSERAPAVLLAAIRVALIISGVGVLLQMISPGLFGYNEAPGRLTGFMNNPNQLAYFSLCALSAMLILRRFKVDFGPFGLLALLGGVIGAIVSTSLAAWGGFAFLVLAVLVANWRYLGRMLRFALAVPVALVSLLYIDAITEGALLDRIDSRIARVDAKLEDVEGERNYDRILAFPQYWALGAGDGANERFGQYGGGEIHSSIGKVFFTYGVVGLSLLFWFFWMALRGAPISGWLVFGALMFYGLTHMGLRSTMFWIVMCLLWYQYARLPGREMKRSRVPALP